MNTSTGVNIKSIPLQNLPPEAFKVVVGENATVADDVLSRYETIPWLYRGVEARCNALSAVPYGIHRGNIEGAEIQESALTFEINIPNLLNAMYRDYILFAQWYLFKGANPVKVVKEVRRMLPRTITPQYDRMAGLTGFARQLGSEIIPIAVDDMIFYMKPPVRTEIGAGVADAVVALAAAGVIGNLDLYAAGYFANGALMPTLISTTGQVQEVDRTAFRSLMRRITGRGAKKAHAVEIVQGDFKATTLGSPPKDLAATELNNTKREDIATALGVPQTVLFSNAANYATALQDDLHFYDKTIRPDALRFEQALNRQLFQPLGLYFTFRWEQMEIYQQQKSQQAQSLIGFVSSGILTKNEVREELGYEDIDNTANSTDDGFNPTDGKSVQPEIFGYHLEQGVVSKNEARERLKLEPIADPQGDALRKLQAQMVVLQSVVATGIPLPAALPLVGLTVDLPPASAAVATDGQPPVNVKHTPANPAEADLARWQTVATKRLKEGKIAKALDFESDALRPSLMASIKGALEVVTDAAEIKHIFADAIEWVAYP